MPLKIATGRPVEQGSDDTSASPASLIRDRLALTHQRMEAQYPGVLDVHAEALAARADELAGVAGPLRGVHEEGHWREMCRGQRTLALFDETRLVLSARQAGKLAVEAYDRTKWRAAGFSMHLVPIVGAVEQVGDAMADVSEAMGRLNAAILRDQADGRIDEAGSHLDAIARVRRELADAETALLATLAARTTAAGGSR